MSFSSYDISLSSLFAASRKMLLTQNNISNAETVGYARQRAEVIENSSPNAGALGTQIGTGVLVDKIIRIKDDIVTQQARREQGTFSYFTETRKDLTTIEALFNETSEGSMHELLGRFFNMWEEMSKFPEEKSYRDQVIGISNHLAGKFNELHTTLSTSKVEVEQKLETNMRKVNDLIDKIADVNTRISRMPAMNPNALYDERDRYVDELSQYVDVKIKPNFENKDLIDVEVGNASLVNGIHKTNIEGYKDSLTGKWVIGAGGVELRVKTGIIKSNLEFYNGYIAKYETKLDDLANRFITEVNNIHQTGYGLDNSTGINFFLGTSASTIAVDPTLIANSEKIATSSSMNTPGNADISKQIANLSTKPFMSSGTTTPTDFYNGFVIEMGMDLSEVAENEEIHEAIFHSIEEERQSIQGVNIDEEMANLMKFQQYYQMNAKVLQMVDESYDTLIGIIR